jgi:hypothetical protein
MSHSHFDKGWALAKRHYPQPPGMRALHVPLPNTVQGEHEQESWRDGYLAWCSGKYEGINARSKR